MVSWTKSQLPTPTNDLDKVANDIDQWGYGLLEDALSEPLLTKTRADFWNKQLQNCSLGLLSRMGAPLKNGAIFVIRMVR